MQRRTLSIVIPTFGRDEVLVSTVQRLLALSDGADEVVVVDQTATHRVSTSNALQRWVDTGRIRWIRQIEPSITQAMNTGLQVAFGDVVLFLDDDIVPTEKLVTVHRSAVSECVISAGRVVQPWHEGQDFSADTHFHFACIRSQTVTEFMGGNFSVARQAAIKLGGFDENFVRVAYRFEADFAKRWLASGGTIRYEPEAMIHHLKADSGGTRSFGHHLTTVRPDHAVGEYYFELKHRGLFGAVPKMANRLLRSVATRHHLRRPWYLPLTIAAEIRGMAWARRLWREGPRYLRERDGSSAT